MGLRSFAQHSPEVLGSSGTLLCLGSFPGLKKGEKDCDCPIWALGMGFPHDALPCATQHNQLKDMHVRLHVRFGERDLPSVPFSIRLHQSQASWDRQILQLAPTWHLLGLLKFK